MIASNAVCFAFFWNQVDPVTLTLEWVEPALALFRSQNLPIRDISFSATLAGQAEVFPDTPYGLDRLKVRLPACTTGDLGIYANREETIDQFASWEGCSVVQLDGKYSFLGVAESVPLALSELSQIHLRMIRSVVRPAYGIGYTHPLLLVPWGYADGTLGGPLGGPLGRKRLRQDRKGSLEAYKFPLRQWRFDQQGDKKAFQGWFRDVYPLQYLNRDHVSARLANGQTLLTAGIGQLTPCGEDRWWWSVTEEELPAARALLTASDRLLCAPTVPSKWHMPIDLLQAVSQ